MNPSNLLFDINSKPKFTNPLSEREKWNMFRIYYSPDLGNQDLEKTAHISGFCRNTVKAYIFENKKIKQPGRPANNSLYRNEEVHNFIKEILDQSCCLYLHEISYLIGNTFDIKPPDVSNVSKICKNLGLNRKRLNKIAWYRKSHRIKRQRMRYCNVIRLYNAKTLYFMDECHTDYRDVTRTHGRCKSGEVPVIYNNPNRKSFSFICCMNYRSVVHTEIFKTGGGANIKHEQVLQYLKNLKRKLPPNHLLVLDNAKTHRVKKVMEYLEVSGIKYIFLPPYSPDLMPVELLFGWIKTKFKKYSIFKKMRKLTIPDLINSAISNVKAKVLYGFVKGCENRWRDFENYSKQIE